MIITSLLLAIMSVLAVIGSIAIFNFFGCRRGIVVLSGLICMIPILFFTVYINNILVTVSITTSEVSK